MQYIRRGQVLPELLDALLYRCQRVARAALHLDGRDISFADVAMARHRKRAFYALACAVFIQLQSDVGRRFSPASTVVIYRIFFVS